MAALVLQLQPQRPFYGCPHPSGVKEEKRGFPRILPIFPTAESGREAAVSVEKLKNGFI